MSGPRRARSPEPPSRRDGKVNNNVASDGTWSINKAGVISVNFPSGPFSGVVSDLGYGTFVYSGSWVGTPKLTVVGGVYCN